MHRAGLLHEPGQPVELGPVEVDEHALVQHHDRPAGGERRQHGRQPDPDRPELGVLDRDQDLEVEPVRLVVAHRGATGVEADLRDARHLPELRWGAVGDDLQVGVFLQAGEVTFREAHRVDVTQPDAGRQGAGTSQPQPEQPVQLVAEEQPVDQRRLGGAVAPAADRILAALDGELLRLVVAAVEPAPRELDAAVVLPRQLSTQRDAGGARDAHRTVHRRHRNGPGQSGQVVVQQLGHRGLLHAQVERLVEPAADRGRHRPVQPREDQRGRRAGSGSRSPQHHPVRRLAHEAHVLHLEALRPQAHAGAQRQRVVGPAHVDGHRSGDVGEADLGAPVGAHERHAARDHSLEHRPDAGSGPVQVERVRGRGEVAAPAEQGGLQLGQHLQVLGVARGGFGAACPGRAVRVGADPRPLHPAAHPPPAGATPDRPHPQPRAPFRGTPARSGPRGGQDQLDGQRHRGPLHGYRGGGLVQHLVEHGAPARSARREPLQNDRAEGDDVLAVETHGAGAAGPEPHRGGSVVLERESGPVRAGAHHHRGDEQRLAVPVVLDVVDPAFGGVRPPAPLGAEVEHVAGQDPGQQLATAHHDRHPRRPLRRRGASVPGTFRRRSAPRRGGRAPGPGRTGRPDGRRARRRGGRTSAGTPGTARGRPAARPAGR